MEKKIKVKLHPFAKEDLKRMSEKDRKEIAEGLSKITSMDDLLAKSEPVDIDKMKKEEPELYKKMMTRIRKIEGK